MASPSSSRGHLELHQLQKRYPSQTGLHPLDLDIRSGEFFTILGPSGCGKTTTLMLLAGFATPDSGSMRLDGRDLARLTPQQRDLGVVFQNYALFPHLTVAQNLAFPLEIRGMGRADIDRRVAEVLALVQLPLPDALPEELSGGQQQRVAIGRALVFGPPVLLMDEPLGALDRNLRLHLQRELKQLQQDLGITVVYVTHDQEEAMSMSDRIALLNHGHLEQVGTPQDLYERPDKLFVAGFLGDNNILPARIDAQGRACLADGSAVALAAHPHQQRVGTSLQVAIRPERVRLVAAGESSLRGTVIDSIFMGHHREVRLRLNGGEHLSARLPNDGRATLPNHGDIVGIDNCTPHWQAFTA